ncbi:hypothetical protein PAE975_6155 (plasmid) [Pseudomonas aeruginosa]|uniref:prepilin-type N-terminal cleavage/methylation domain-containing protein n=1 Tax=Pseudomonas aeruginosa TaxID=287 RepID=UPI00375099E3
MDHRKARSRQGGFTLLEVMIAVAIMASMAAAMTPVWINEYNEGRAKITIEETQSILDAARKFRVQNGTWPGGATCLSAVTALKGTTPPLLAGVTNINKFNQTLSTSCTATTFSIDQTVAADYDGVVANGLANTVVLSSPANSVRTTIGTPGSEPALDSKLSRIAETNAQLNRMETTLLLGGNNITEVGHIDASSLNVSGSTTTGSLGVTGNATVAGTTNTGVLGVTGNALIGGNAGVVGTTTLNGALTANTTSRFNGAADFREIVKLNKVVTEGTACSDTGAIARNSAGLTLSCQSGVWTSTDGVKQEAEIYGLDPALWPDSIGCFTGASQGVTANFYSYSSGVVTYLVGASHQIYFNASGVIYSGAYGLCSVGRTMASLINAGLTTN